MHVPEIVEKSKINEKIFWLEKIGVENVFSLQTYQNDIINEIIAKYGNDYLSYIEKIEQIAQKEKYGIEWKYITIQKLNTCHSEESKQKCYNTRKKNNTFKSSKLENALSQYLIEKYGENNIKTQYHSPEYPYNCDFYIIPLNLYIELQGTWTHGGKPFENTENDIKKLQLWESKNTIYYNNAIINWTIKDVQKRQTAIKNNLNYLEIFASKIDNVIEIFEKYIKNYYL